MRRLFLGGAIAVVAVMMFAVTLQSLLTEAPERWENAAANLVHIKRSG